jgi:hypothetical protein
MYYIAIPIYFIVFALKFAPIRNSQIQLNKIIEDNKIVVTGFVFDFLGSVVSDSILLEESSVKQIVDDYLDEYIYTDSIESQQKNGIGRKFIYQIKKSIEFTFLSKVLEARIIKEATGLIGINKNTGKAIYKTNFHDLFHDGELVEILKMEIDSLFNKIYKSMIVVFLIGLIFPAIEILLSRYYKY